MMDKNLGLAFDKLLIENSKRGRKDGAYSRLLGNNELGALISRIHATSISAGSFLENYLASIGPLLPKEEIPRIFNNTLPDGVFLVSKKTIKICITHYVNLSKAIEPDYLIVDSLNKKCLVIELKDGDNFDTKKAQGEVSSLVTYSNALSNKLPYPWTSEIKVCMFNQVDKLKIVNGFKSRITIGQAMSGDEFCQILNLDKSKVDEARKQACEKNFNFTISELLKIPEVLAKVNEIIQKECKLV